MEEIRMEGEKINVEILLEFLNCRLEFLGLAGNVLNDASKDSSDPAITQPLVKTNISPLYNRFVLLSQNEKYELALKIRGRVDEISGIIGVLEGKEGDSIDELFEKVPA